MKVISIFIFFLLFSYLGIEPSKTYEIKSDYVLSDALGNFYSLNGNSITLYSNDGQKLFSYSNPFFGDISYADVTDPMRILLFYKDFNKIVFLSNKLSEIGSPIELDNAGYSQVSICCTSHRNGFWIFDSQSLQLIHLNGNLEPLNKGTILQDIFKNTDKSPTCLLEENDRLYMGLENEGILVFDKFGSYLKTIQVIDLKTFQVKGEKIIYFSKNYLYSFTNNFESDSLLLPENLKIKSVSINKNQLFASNCEQIFLFNL